MGFWPKLRRMHRLHNLLISSLMLSGGVQSAQAATGYNALDTAAIPVMAPGHTPLLAVTRVGRWLFAAGAHGVIVRSSDNGVTWQQGSVPVDVTLTSLYFISEQQGWAVGHYGVILQTDDGGQTWRKVVDGLNVIQTLDSVAAQLPADSQAPADLLAQKVAHVYQADGPSKPFLSVGRCDNGILAAGHQDMSMFSTDDGKTWRQWVSTIDAAGAGFHDIYAMLDEGSATYLIAEDGHLLKSDSGCADFKQVQGPFTATLFGGLAIKPRSMLLFGLDGGIFVTQDDAASWRSVPAPSDAVFEAGVMSSSGHVLLGTGRGNLFLSTDGLQSFHELSLSEPLGIASMALAPNGDVVMAGPIGISILQPQTIR